MSPQFAVLSESQMQDLHLAALETLRRTGIRFFHPEAIEMLRHAGAFVSDGNLVKITAAMVEDAIATVPGRIIMCDRDGAPTVFLEGTKVNFGTGSDCLNLLDPETGRAPPVHPAGPHQRLPPVRCAAQHRLRDVHRHPGRCAAARHLRRADGADAGAHQQAARLRHQRQGELPAGDRHGRGRRGRLRRSLRSKPTSCSTPSPARRSSNRRPPSTSCC